MRASLRLFSLLLPLLVSLSACGDKNAAAQGAGGTPPPPAVPVITIAEGPLALSTELPGRIEALRVAQVRARAPGIVLQRVFTEGSDVKAGQVLFKIDPAAFQASFDSASAAVAKAEANLAQAELKAKRYKPLLEASAVSQQEYDDAVTAQKQAAADLATARAARQSASINLGYTTVTAPIAGRIGRALVTEGALVGQNEATPMALVQQLDPVYVTITQPATDLLKLKRALAAGQLKSAGKDQAKVSLVLDNGEVYGQPGKLLFSDISVDESSGAVTVRAEFPNKNMALLPGMYVRARLDTAVKDAAIVVPQQAVQRGPEGASVFVVGADNKVGQRPVVVDQAQGNNWVIASGLKAGERIVVEGFQKLRPGAPVQPVPWKGPVGAPAAAAASAR
ncbi:efflux RND transporter periplasmic adaptor subunit [Massilia sp. TS11]|uniref:efflux RND transporter periplasmic adaptor subunit n=1 Tax=Massilia sp. TS11 TaxID=2908003 RepID=UPI001EDA76AF|nr:efflux RND transporter periplasmic adaptor subunit [Massilia sp. TS11]MCG2582913.1 efflux RND transporter periplasmic adaptor subunit [Massilia sp. TS11]